MFVLISTRAAVLSRWLAAFADAAPASNNAAAPANAASHRDSTAARVEISTNIRLP